MNQSVMSHLLDEHASRNGGKVFVRDRQSQATYREMAEGSDRVANHLHGAIGVKPGDKVAVLLANSVDFLYVQFGVAKAGAVMVPVNTLATADLLAHFLNNSDASVVILEKELLPLVASVRARTPKVKALVIRGEQSFADMLGAPAVAPAVELNWYDPVDIFYTSGTTGVSKGVVLSHQHHYVFGQTIAKSARLGSDDVMYICLPLYHGMGSYMSIMPMLIHGGSIALASGFSASRWLDDIRHFGATVTWGVYSIAPILMKQTPRPNDRENPLRVYLFTGMAPTMGSAFEERFGVRIVDHYGATESAHLAYSAWDERRSGAVGPVNSEHYEVAVVDEHDNPLPPGEVGECVSRCRLPYTQMTEYYKMPEATLEAFRNRWLHSGDLVRIDADGWLYFVGRGKDMIRRRGENISCFELESLLQACEDVQECAAVPVPSELGEDEVKVVVSPRDGRALTHDAVMTYCRENLPKFMLPRYIEIVPEVPKLGNQKIDKVALKQAGINTGTWDASTGELTVDRPDLC